MIVAALVMGVAAPKTSAEKVDKQTLLETVNADSSDNNKETVDSVEENKETAVSTEEKKEPSKTSADNKEQEKENPVTSVSDNEIVEETINTPPSIDPMPEDDTGFTVNEETVEIRVISGDSSVSVSRRVFEAGLVESAVEFDQYLCKEGYDKYICVGTYDIPSNADFETLAKILTRRN